MHTHVAAHRARPRHPKSPAALCQLEAVLAAVAAVLFLAVFAAGYYEVNLVAGAIHTVQLAWSAATTAWTYVIIGAVLLASRALRAQHA